MPRIIGIDPGLRCTGYGIIETNDRQTQWITHGQINTSRDCISERLQQIYQKVKAIIAEYNPEEAAIEQVFMQTNFQSALKLGQARGAAIVAISSFGLPLGEYSPRQIKQAVVGYGAASKIQVQQMIRSLLRMTHTPPSDAADALAIALCHCHTSHISRKIANAEGRS